MSYGLIMHDLSYGTVDGVSANLQVFLDTSQVSPGGSLGGVFAISGGTEPQQIRGLAASLNIHYFGNQHDKNGRTKQNHAYCEIEVDGFSFEYVRDIIPGEIINIPFQIQAPLDCPISVGSVEAILRARLDDALSGPPSVEVPVTVVPDEIMAAIFDAMEYVGFQPTETECMHRTDQRPQFVQEFDYAFDAYSGFGRAWDLSEVSITFLPPIDPRMTNCGVSFRELKLAADRKATLHMPDAERSTRLVFDMTDVSSGCGHMAKAIAEAIDRIG